MATELKPEIKDGMSQSERYLLSLDTAYFGIDEKDTTDLLKLLTDLSGQFNYYNFSNQIEGDWKEFLTSDIDILIALLSKLDHRAMAESYRQLANQLQLAENEKRLILYLKNIFQFIHDFTLLQIGYHNRFEMVNHLEQVYHFESATPALLHHLQKLYAYNNCAAALLGNDVRILFNPKALHYIDNSNFDVVEDPFINNGSTHEKVMLAIPYFDRLIEDLDMKYAGLLNISRQYLKKQSMDGDVYDPHVALLISFLHLYSYLQQPVNHLIKKHLDYFYRDLIGMKNKPEHPDRVHLVIEPAAAGSFILAKGEKVTAEIPGYQDKLFYALENDVQLSGAKVAGLKTLFISNKRQVVGKQSSAGDVNELQVYQGDYSSFVNTPWPLLGEDQSELSPQQKTMQEADLGLMVASSLFYQTDGRRDFRIKFFIAGQSFSQFDTHVDHLSKASSISKEVLMMELLNQSFVVAITGTSGWINIKDYAVSRSSATDPGFFIEVKFKLDYTAEAVALYNSKLHGYNFDVQWPIVRLMLNNLAFHHPYTFLSYFIIERITVKVVVKESKRFKLKNNTGELYSEAPFQPFGSNPVNGSYLDIKNTAIFNRYTTSFCMQLHWFDLPADENGFTDYYAGYNYPFNNRSFKIQLNSNADAKAVTATEEQQVFQLFNYKTDNGKEHLVPRTTISDIDFRRIKFDNVLALDQEDTVSFAKQGTVRLELTEPYESFGHRLYPKAFTGTVEQNARRFAKKRPMPNPPYVPVIKLLSIDYTLEHSELTNGNSFTNEEEVIMIHLYPFGYDQFYTGKNSNPNFFIPPANHESNLFIGLTDLIPNQELSFLFQLSEQNFHHSVHEPEEVSWSHLVKNRWISIPVTDVLQDTTTNFVNSGVVTLKIPGQIEKNNTILDPELYWLSVSVPGESALKARVIAVLAQAAVAIRVPGQSQFPAHSYTIPPGAIKSFYGNVQGIKTVSQRYSSFGGQPEESDYHYAIRVSERLRHKQRPLSILDISQAVLDAFPQLLMVKCYAADHHDHMLLPDTAIQLIVIPKEKEDGTFISQEPKVNLSLLYAIKKFINSSVSSFVGIEVCNPVYERIMVVAKVKFKHPGTVRQSDGYYLKLLNQDIKKYISAWLFDTHSDFQIGSKIYISEVLNHLQHREYIDYITKFSLIHFYKIPGKTGDGFDAKIRDTSIDPVDYLQGSTQGAILIPAEEHLITVTDMALPEDPERSGIGDFSIGNALLISPDATPAAATAESTALSFPEDLYDFIVFNH